MLKYRFGVVPSERLNIVMNALLLSYSRAKLTNGCARVIGSESSVTMIWRVCIIF